MSSRKIAITALLTALALIVFVIEAAIPPLIPIAPGVKLGLSNVFVMLAVLFCGNISGLIVAVLKCFLGSIFSGNLFALFYSLPASLASLGLFILCYQLLYKKISITAMSVLCAMLFNLCQIVSAAIVLSSMSVVLYLPYVLLVGGVMGLFTGIVVHFIIKTHTFRGERK